MAAVDRRGFLGLLTGATAAGCLRVSETTEDGTANEAAAAEGGSSPGGAVDTVTPAGDAGAPADGASQPWPAREWPEFQSDPANTGYIPAEVGLPRTLEPRWRFRYDLGRGLPHQAPIIASGTVLFQNATILHGLDVTTGESRWRLTTETGVDGIPAYADGTVYFRTKGGPLFAVGVTDGSTRWNVPLDASGTAIPTVVGGTVYLAAEGVHAFDATDGSVRWRSNRGNAIGLREGRVYATDRSRVVALDANTGDPLWETPETENERWSRPVVGERHVYVTDVDHHTVRAFDASDGSEVWRFQTRSAVNGNSSAAVADGTVYVGDEGGELYALNARDGTVLWSAKTGGSIFFSPIVIGDAIYVGSDTTSIVALDTDDPDDRLPFASGESGFYLAYANGTFYVTTGNRLYAVEEA